MMLKKMNKIFWLSYMGNFPSDCSLSISSSHLSETQHSGRMLFSSLLSIHEV